MKNENDTICAVSTAPGVGGIAVIRVSGPQAIAAVDTLWEGKPLAGTPGHHARFGRILDRAHGGEMLDEAVATVFRAPRSFTGEDVVELSVHGSRYVQRRLLQLLEEAGCRLADAGEFTRRAFANGKMDLAQAEAVADVIASNSRAAHRLAASQMKGAFSRRLEELRDKLLELASLLELELDFSEEDVEFASRARLREIAREVHDEVTRLAESFSAGNAIKEGIPVAIVGPTNAGKSSLLNLLLGEDRAIVSDIHGTTRDTIEDTLEIGDYTFRFIDTAGLRDTADPIEALGIQRSRAAASRAAITILVLDATSIPAEMGDGVAPGKNTTDGDSVDSAANSTNKGPSAENWEKNVTAGDSVSRTANSTDKKPSAENWEKNREDSALLKSTLEAVADAPLIVLLNKADLVSGLQATALPTAIPLPHHPSAVIPFSTKTRTGHTDLLSTLTAQADLLRGTTDEDTILVTNLRHAASLRAAAESTAAILSGLSASLPGDLIAQDLRATIHHLSSITGTLTTPDILASIFSRFCIGK